MSAVEVVNRRALAKVLAGLPGCGPLADAVGTAQAKGLDDRVSEAPEVEHGVEIENEVENEIEHGIEIEVAG